MRKLVWTVICLWRMRKFQFVKLLDKLEFIALKRKGSDCEAGNYFSWRDTDKIISAKHDRHEVAGFWRWTVRQT